MGDAVLRFAAVSKRFRLGESHDSLRDLLTSLWHRLRRKTRTTEGDDSFWALRDVNFSVARGEAVGIIGPNGAGKSTVLKLLAGILRPDRGSIAVHGRLAALIEVGAGFHGDLTGLENIYLNGAILGMSRAEIRRKLDAIVAFAGLERFLDMPVKRYSSGMYARLGFSIASHVDPDILLVDEVLSVGDAVFRLRCMERMRGLLRGGTTLVLVTHNLDQMQSICARAIVLEGGRLEFDGSARAAVGHYMTVMSRAYASRPTDLIAGDEIGDAAPEIVDLRFINRDHEEVVWARSAEPLRLELVVRLPRAVPRLVVEFNMRATAEENLISLNSGRDGLSPFMDAGEHVIRLELPALPIRGGQYWWNVRLWDVDRGTTELDSPFRHPLMIDDGGQATGMLCLAHEWKFDVEERVAATVASARGNVEQKAAVGAMAGQALIDAGEAP